MQPNSMCNQQPNQLEKEFAEELYYLIHNIRDPEKQYSTLADLNVVTEDGVTYS
jgi:hypothetical protein